MTIHPKRLFLIDSMGALLTAFMLGIVLAYFDDFFGMPKRALHILAGIALVFFLYSLSCYLKFPPKWQSYLKLIAIANLSYCILSLGFVAYYFQRLSWWGVAYFFVEIIVVVGLVSVEWKTLKRSILSKVD